jgi:hypothetical protein
MDDARVLREWGRLAPVTRLLWRRVTDDDIALIGGDRDRLVSTIGTRYGYTPDRAERAVGEWLRSVVFREAH